MPGVEVNLRPSVVLIVADQMKVVMMKAVGSMAEIMAVVVMAQAKDSAQS
jgi:hypothetical protein